MTSALADDWRDVPPPVVSHPRDALTLGRWPWDTAPQSAPVAPAPKPRPTLPTYGQAAASLGVSPSSLWKRLRRKRISARVGLPLEAWRTLADGLARVGGAR